ncbi:MAG: 5-formyltetrahydrofolate cyclo-ligase [Polyangiaceae bacterium]|nr:5-formyltetrahydrofolate cyclo-ligase [Polyangiaceae bacterium]
MSRLAPEEFIRAQVKAELRKRMRGLRKTVPVSACETRSAAILSRLLSLDVFANPKSVALFWPILVRHEVDLRRLDTSLRARGIRVAYPAIVPETNVMTFRYAEDPLHLDDQGYGFLEPPLSAVEAKALDVIVVPALAVDPAGQRIGYGAGYYDRTLPNYAPPAVTIAVAYDWQLVSEVPVTEGDIAVAWVVTDARTLRV